MGKWGEPMDVGGGESPNGGGLGKNGEDLEDSMCVTFINVRTNSQPILQMWELLLLEIEET